MLWRLFILSAGPLLAAEFREHTIATDLKGGYQVVVEDLNRDGKPDLIALASGMPELIWFEGPNWTRHVIAGPFNRMINVAASDIDGDGRPELVLAHEFANQAKNSIGIVSVLRQQDDPRKPWAVQEIDRLTTSHRLRWADVDGSGKKIAINAPLTGAKAEPPDYKDHVPLVFYRPGAWKRETIGTETEGVMHGIYIADWDGDRRDDVLTASFSGLHVYRLSKAGRWTREEISSRPSSDVAIGRLGRTRYLAVIEPWHGNRVVVYRKKGRAWQPEVVDESLVDGHTIQTGDFSGNRQEEIIAGYRGQGRSVYRYRMVNGRWEKSTLDGGGIAAAACSVADLNGDGRADVACIGSATANLKWYENVGGRD